MAIVYESIYSVDLPFDNDKKKYENETQTKRIEQKEIPWHRRQTLKKEIPEHMKPYTHVCNEDCDDACPETCGLPSRLFKSKCPFIVEKKGDMCRFHQSCNTCPVCRKLIMSKRNEFITTCGHSYHKKCREKYERKSWKSNTWKCHVCKMEQAKLIETRYVKHMKILKDLKTKEDELVIEAHSTESVENKTFLLEPLYNFLQYVFLTV